MKDPDIYIILGGGGSSFQALNKISVLKHVYQKDTPP